MESLQSRYQIYVACARDSWLANQNLRGVVELLTPRASALPMLSVLCIGGVSRRP
jgi:hypothetical protein